MQNKRNICKICHRVYSLDSSNTTHCYECTQNIITQNLHKHNRTCKYCNKTFVTAGGGLICPFCKTICYEQGKEPKDYTEINLKPKSTTKPKNLVSISERIKRMEYMRVMDNKGWSHYLKGNKWDKI